MITYDDDNITFFFGNGESRSYRRTERSLELDPFIEPMHAEAWLRRTDEAMFANYYEPCLDR